MLIKADEHPDNEPHKEEHVYAGAAVIKDQVLEPLEDILLLDGFSAHDLTLLGVLEPELVAQVAAKDEAEEQVEALDQHVEGDVGGAGLAPPGVGPDGSTERADRHEESQKRTEREWPIEHTPNALRAALASLAYRVTAIVNALPAAGAAVF